MRIRFAALAALSLLAPLTQAAPAAAQTGGLFFDVTPVAGAPGTQITVSGTCVGGSTVDLALQFPVRSDALAPPIDTATAQVVNGEFTAQLTNDIVSSQQVPAEDPVDLEVRATCGNSSQRQPFASTQRTTQDNPTIFTGLGQGPCGHGFGPPGVDLSIPCPVHVKGTNATGAVKNSNFYAFDDRGGRGAEVAAAFIDEDALPDVVVGSNPGQATVGVYWGDTGGSFSFTPFGGYNGPITVAVGDVLGDSAKEIIAAAGPGGGPHVVVANLQGTILSSFYAYAPSFTGGVSVAAANTDGDAKDEIVTGAGPGGGPHLRTFEGTGVANGNGFFAYDPKYFGGLNVAAGDIAGDAKAEIVTGTRPGGGPHVAFFNADGTKVAPGFYAYASNFNGGVSVAVGNVNGQAGNEIVTGPYIGGDPHVRVFTSTAGASADPGFYAYSKIPAGVRVAVVR